MVLASPSGVMVKNPAAAVSGMILVADADADAAQLLAQHLSRQGLQVVHTSSGEAVLSLARSSRLRLAIVDVSLQDMSGHGLASRLREIDSTIPVLMTSADHRPETEVRARQAGIIYFAHKPADCDLIEAVVTKALSESESP